MGGSVRFVDADATGLNNGSTWADAFVDLHDALAVARSGDEIWIAEGVYKPDRGSGDRRAFYDVPAGVTIYGGFAGHETSPDDRDLDRHETILSGDLNGDNGPQDCESLSDCCSAHTDSGCDDAQCTAIVCNRYDDCCDGYQN